MSKGPWQPMSEMHLLLDTFELAVVVVRGYPRNLRFYDVVRPLSPSNLLPQPISPYPTVHTLLGSAQPKSDPRPTEILSAHNLYKRQ